MVPKMSDMADDFDPRTFPRKLNLGCGYDLRPGYLNIDFQEFHSPELVADVRKLDMLPSEFYHEIIAQDILEHLARCDTLPTLREWSRLLVPCGVLKIRTPNLIGLMHLFLKKRSVEEQLELTQCAYGTQAYTGDFHLNSFTEITLRYFLHESGFLVREIEPFDEWMFNVTAEKHAQAVFELGSLPFMQCCGSTAVNDAPTSNPTVVPYGVAVRELVDRTYRGVARRGARVFQYLRSEAWRGTLQR